MLQIACCLKTIAHHTQAALILTRSYKPLSMCKNIVKSIIRIQIFSRHTFSWKRVVIINKLFEGEGDAQKLHITVPVPHQQFLAGLDFFAGLVVYLSFRLHSNQVLLFWKARTLHQGHPIPWSASSIHKVTQAPILKNLNTGRENIHLINISYKPELPVCSRVLYFEKRYLFLLFTSHMSVLSS